MTIANNRAYANVVAGDSSAIYFSHNKNDGSGTMAATIGSYVFAPNSSTGLGLEFRTGGASTSVRRMVIDNTGNVGIGTTSPGVKLQVDSGTQSSVYLSHVAPNLVLGDNVAFASLVNSTMVGLATIADNFLTGATVGDSIFGGKNNLLFGTGLTPGVTNGNIKMVITTAGNVGIGTVSPGAKLDVKSSGNSTWALRARSSVADQELGGIYQGSTGNADFYLYDSSNSNFFRSNPSGTYITQGNVGIGTTSPLAKLHVSGHCVTGDTMLPIRRRRKRKKGDGEDDDEDPASADGYGEAEWDYFLCRIDEILPGDEVLSLNEEYWDTGTGDTQSEDQGNVSSGALEYAHIHELMDMGIHDVYELTTKSGRKIRTTAEHPYLIKVQS